MIAGFQQSFFPLSSSLEALLFPYLLSLFFPSLSSFFVSVLFCVPLLLIFIVLFVWRSLHDSFCFASFLFHFVC